MSLFGYSIFLRTSRYPRGRLFLAPSHIARGGKSYVCDNGDTGYKLCVKGAIRYDMRRQKMKDEEAFLCGFRNR